MTPAITAGSSGTSAPRSAAQVAHPGKPGKNASSTSVASKKSKKKAPTRTAEGAGSGKVGGGPAGDAGAARKARTALPKSAGEHPRVHAPTARRAEAARQPTSERPDVSAHGASATKARAARKPASKETSEQLTKESVQTAVTSTSPTSTDTKSADTKSSTARRRAGSRRAPDSPRGPYAQDEKFLAEQRQLLETERSVYLAQASDLKAEADSLAQEREPGDVQFDEESGEGGTVTVDRERDLALSAQALAAVGEIDAALAKIADGTYGVCERCGQPIPKPRLKALPYARLCVACKSGGLSRR